MNGMVIRREPGGDLRLERIPAFLAGLLMEIPDLLSDLDPRAQERLFPRAFEEEEEEEQWRRLAGPDLAHLFQDRIQVIRGDLEGLVPEGGGMFRAGEETFQLEIPAGHQAAWLSGLNAARLALYETEGFSPEDMRKDPEEMDEPGKALALFQIHAMAVFQEILLEGRLP